MSMFSQVRIMNEAFNNPFGGCTSPRLLSQIKNLADEYHELVHAISTRNKVEVRDAACDLLVFALGGFHLMGIHYDEWNEEQIHEVRLKRPLEGDVFLHLELHAKKFPTLFADLEKHLFIFKSYQLNYVASQLNLIIAFTLGIHALLGLDVEADMTAVYESNMSKFCKNVQELKATLVKYDKLSVLTYYEGEYPTKCVKSLIDQADVNGQNYPEGKFLKGVSFKAPVFA